MENPGKIKSRWRKEYFEGENNVDEDDDQPNRNSHNHNNDHHHHHHHHHRHHKSSKHSSSSVPPTYEHLEENLYLDEKSEEEQRRNKKAGRSMVCDCKLTKDEKARNVMGCKESCLNRMLMIECGGHCPLKELCSNKKFQKSESAQLELFKTRKKGWGLKTVEALPAGTFIMEYVGEVIRSKEFKNRVKKYTKQKIKHHYFMALRNDEIIDATTKGNQTRFINHSCEPNCETQKWTVNGELRIGFFTIKNIQPGEEITFDYQFQRYGKKAQKCYCEAPTCRGFIGGNEQTYVLDGDESPQGENENDSDNQETNQPTGFRIPKLNKLQKLEIERELEEERRQMEAEANADIPREEKRHPFAQTNYFKPTTYAPQSGSGPTANPLGIMGTNGTTNGFSHHSNINSNGNNNHHHHHFNNHHHNNYPNLANNVTNGAMTIPPNLSVKRHYDSMTKNLIDLTPPPKKSREEYRLEFETYVKLEEYMKKAFPNGPPAGAKAALAIRKRALFRLSQMHLNATTASTTTLTGGITTNTNSLNNSLGAPPTTYANNMNIKNHIAHLATTNNSIISIPTNGTSATNLTTIVSTPPISSNNSDESKLNISNNTNHNYHNGHHHNYNNINYENNLDNINCGTNHHNHQVINTIINNQNQSNNIIINSTSSGSSSPNNIGNNNNKNNNITSSLPLIVLANNSIEPGLEMSDELAFSICNHDEYYSSVRDKGPSYQDIRDDLYPYPGSYYTTPDGDTWFATVILDGKTQKPRSVIMNIANNKNNDTNNK